MFPLSKPQKAVVIQVGGLIGAALFLAVLGHLYPLDRIVLWLRANVQHYQPWSTLAYPFFQAACNLLLLPAGVLIIASGFFFGLWKGLALVLLGHLLGAAAAFGISRLLARGLVEKFLARRPEWIALDRAIEREGWKIVFLSQLNPLFPTSLINYGYGLTRMRFWPCLGWIALGQAPGMFFYAYLGRMGHIGYKLWREGAEAAPEQFAVWIAGLVVSLGLTLALGQLAMRLLRETQERPQTDALRLPADAPDGELADAGMRAAEEEGGNAAADAR